MRTITCASNDRALVRPSGVILNLKPELLVVIISLDSFTRLLDFGVELSISPGKAGLIYVEEINLQHLVRQMQ